MQSEPTDLDTRVQNAMFGLPLLKPDEQHRCLGTFFERIELKITFAEALRWNCVPAMEALIKHPQADYQLLLNGQLDIEITGQYIRLANRYHLAFAIKTSQFYHTEADRAAIILCADHALNRPEVDVLKRFPKLAN